MSWRDSLLTASFRGVEFYYSDTDRSGGRRVAEHEFVLRDGGSTEDLGLKLRHYRFSGYVLGTDYFADRDALLTAVETEGAGTLIHPYLGALTVRCAGYTLREGAGDGGTAQFDFDFVEAGEMPSPSVSVSTADTADTAATAAESAASEVFSDTYSLDDYGSLISDYAADACADLSDDLSDALDGISLITDSITALKESAAEIADSYGEATSLVAAVTGFFDDLGDAIIAALPDGSVDESANSRGGATVGDPSYGLAALAAWDDADTITGETAWKVQAIDNRSALIVLVQSAAVAQLARVYAATSFAGSADAETARDQLTGFIDDLALSAADNGDNAAYKGWMALMAAVTDDLTTRGKQLPDVVTVSFPDVLPAVAAAQKLYADASRAGEIIARNAAPHPLFLPASLEVLSA